MLVSMSRGALNSFPCAWLRFTTEFCICCLGAPMFDLPFFSMTAKRAVNEGPAGGGEPAAERLSTSVVEAEEAALGEVTDACLFLADDFFTDWRGGIVSPNTFQAFRSSSLSNGIPQYLSTRCFRVSKGTSAIYNGSNCCSKNSPKVGVNRGFSGSGGGTGLAVRTMLPTGASWEARTTWVTGLSSTVARRCTAASSSRAFVKASLFVRSSSSASEKGDRDLDLDLELARGSSNQELADIA